VRTAERVIALLADSGIQRIYGWAGEGSCLDLIEAARARDIALVAPRQQASAVIMAGTEGDLLGRPGVCVAPGEPWACLAGLAHAASGRNPAIFLFSRSSRGIRAESEDRFEQALRAIAKGGAEVATPRTERLVQWAWKKANLPPKGPVYLGISPERSSRLARGAAPPLASETPASPSPGGIRRIARLLAGAGRAVVLAGMGCRDPLAAAALLELTEHLGAPVFTTRRAKGAFPEDHALSAGVFLGSRWEQQLLARADCVLTVGLDPTGVIPERWRSDLPVFSIQEYGGRSPYRARAEIWGNIAQALDRLRQELPPSGEWRLAEWAQRAARFKERSRALLANGTRNGLGPDRVVAMARSVFPRHTLACVDSGAHALAVAAFWEAYDPKGYLAPVEGGTGSALPAAIAAKLTLPDRPVIAFVGERGLFASLGDLATAGELGLPIVAVVFLDEPLSNVPALQEQRYYAPVGGAAGPILLVGLAEQLGVLGIQVDTEAELQQALQDAVAAPRPAVIGVRINPHGYRRVFEALAGAHATP